MAQVTIVVGGVSVTCDVSEVAQVTAALAGSGLAAASSDDGGGSRPGERRRENPDDATQRGRAEEFRKIRGNYTSKSVEEVAAAGLPRDTRKRTPHAGDR